MGLFDFLKVKSNTEEVSENPDGVTSTEQPKKQEPVIEVKIPQVTSKPKGGETIKDIEGNEYTTLKIGNQVWTVENLKTTKYNDGTPIPLVADELEWEDLETPAYCWYDNDIGNKDKYGALYNWYTVNTGKLAPKGWHVPTDDEWTKLEEYLIANGYNWDGTKEENKIAKSMASKTDWDFDDDEGTMGNDLTKNNRSGFSALPGGYRSNDGSFSNVGYYGGWWSATENDASYAWHRSLHYGSDHLLRYHYGNKSCGLSVRLLRD